MIRTLLIFLISISGFAQCKIIKNEIDPFTKQKIIETKTEDFAYADWKAKVIRFQGIKKDEDRYLKTYIVLNTDFVISSDNNLLLLNENGDVITLPFNNTLISDANTVLYQTTWYVIKSFKLTEELYNTLKFGKYSQIRVETTKGFIDFEIPKSNKENLQKVLQCIY